MPKEIIAEKLIKAHKYALSIALVGLIVRVRMGKNMSPFLIFYFQQAVWPCDSCFLYFFSLFKYFCVFLPTLLYVSSGQSCGLL